VIYYAKGNNVYSCEVLLANKEFVKISKEEYDKRMSVAKANREQGIRVTDYNEM